MVSGEHELLTVCRTFAAKKNVPLWDVEAPQILAGLNAIDMLAAYRKERPDPKTESALCGVKDQQTIGYLQLGYEEQERLRQVEEAIFVGGRWWNTLAIRGRRDQDNRIYFRHSRVAPAIAKIRESDRFGEAYDSDAVQQEYKGIKFSAPSSVETFLTEIFLRKNHRSR